MKFFTSTLLTLATMTVLTHAATKICVPMVLTESQRSQALDALDRYICNELDINSDDRSNCGTFRQANFNPESLRLCGSLAEGAPGAADAKAASPGSILEDCIPVAPQKPGDYQMALDSMKITVCDPMALGDDKNNCDRFVAGQVVKNTIEACGTQESPSLAPIFPPLS